MLEQQQREAEVKERQERRRAEAHPDDLEEEELQQVCMEGGPRAGPLAIHSQLLQRKARRHTKPR